MHVSESTYSRVTKAVGLLLTFMGLSLLGAFALFAITGANPVTAGLPISAVGQLSFASIGAFALPVGAFLLLGGPDIQGRLQIASVGLGLMAVVRLVAFTNIEIRSVVGAAPLVEFFVLGTIAAVALFLRPSPTNVT